MLNFARADVREWAFGWLDALLSEHDITFVKWDCNRGFSEPGWPDALHGNPERVWVDHVRGVYEVLDRLRARHPDVELESCASGGGRVDLGMLARAEQTWTSDNTDARDRLFIQEGFSQVYPARAMMCWVTDVPNFATGRSTPLGYRFVVAMAGGLGVGGDLAKWPVEERAEAARWIKLYKEIRDTVQAGRQFRLASPGEDRFSAVLYTAEDAAQAILLVAALDRHFGETFTRLRLRGLDPDARYRVRVHPADPAALPDPVRPLAAEREVPGRLLRHDGLLVPLWGDAPAACLVLDRLPG